MRLTYDATTAVAYLSFRATGPADILGPTLLLEHDRNLPGAAAKVPRGWMKSSVAVTDVGSSAAGMVPVVVVVMVVSCVSVSFMVPFPGPRWSPCPRPGSPGSFVRSAEEVAYRRERGAGKRCATRWREPTRE
jgi:hypothetical protein